MKLNLLLLVLSVLLVFGYSQQKISLRDVTALTFHQGRVTAARRTTPMPQLSQVGGVREYTPQTIQCTNSGFDGQSIQWKCVAAGIPKKYKLGHVEVVCEGYDHPGDQYILVGSCGLEYTLEYTGSAHNNRRHSRQRKTVTTKTRTHNSNVYVDQTSGFSTFFWIVFLIALLGICVCLSAAPSGRASAGPPTGGFQPIYPTAPTYGSTTYVDSGFGSGFSTGYTMGSMNNRTTYSAPPQDYTETTTTTHYDSNDRNDRDDDDNDIHDSTAFGGSRTR
jgi:hypothetical protein